MKVATHDLDLTISLPVADRTAADDGAVVDLADASGCGIFVFANAIAGTHSIAVQHSDADDAGFVDVAPDDLSGPLFNLSANSRQKVSYIGVKRYVKAISTSAGGTGNFGVVIVRTLMRKLAVA
ncbi:MAG: hypothetical protein AB7P40_16075 [Chloroflexota bacterium]